MNISAFIQKIKTYFPLKKKSIVIGSIGLVVVLTLTFLIQNTTMLASILSLRAEIKGPVTKKVTICSDSDGGKNYTTKGTISLKGGITTTLQDSCTSDGQSVMERFCNNSSQGTGMLQSETSQCSQGCKDSACRKCNNPEGVLACSLGLDSCDSLCMGSYGYGYGWGGQGTGYGYGYGYLRLDRTTNQPYIYLIRVLKTYSKTIYDAVINRLSSLVPVKYYNKKEFTGK